MRISKQHWQRIRETYARSLAPRGIHLSVDRAWARTSDGRWLVLPAATDHPKPDSWWLGFDEHEIAERPAAGAILLCRSSDGAIADFGLPANLLREIAPHLVLKRGTHHRQFTVVRRAGRYALVMKRGRELDITPRRGDLSWLALSAEPRTSSAGEPDLVYGSRIASTARPDPDRGSPTTEARFFARCQDGKLQPVDPVDLDEGSIYLVVAAPAPLLPVVGAERRILAAARSLGLPADLSEQHDHYAHGAPRR